ncbi:MAG TPA: P-loop NTPase fold protein [Longimicrobium sp.]
MKWIPRFGRRPPIELPVHTQPTPRAGAGDAPIGRTEDDALGRTKAAHAFADQVMELDASAGLVVGVVGPWGAGKTSFINLARDEFARADVPVLDFNPWMFAGAEQLVESFFVELSAQLRVRPGFGEIGERFAAYGEGFSGMGWLPLVGPWIERGRHAAKLVATILKRRKEGTGGRRKALEHALATLTRPIIVVIDDVDRLTTREIRDVFRLVRLTASFPNVIYVLAFDRARVERALAEEGVPGRDYLEKILQLAVDLPPAPREVLASQVFAEIEKVLEGIADHGPFDEHAWPDIFAEVVHPLIRNMRDVRRYGATLRGTIRALEGNVALADVLGLEAVRVFLPDVHSRLHECLGALTTTSGMAFGAGAEDKELARLIGSLVETGGPHADVIRSMIRRLFPAAERHLGGTHYTGDWVRTWNRNARVAHEDRLRLYLERTAGPGLQAYTEATRAWQVLSNAEALEGVLRSIEPSRLEDVIAGLENFEEEFAVEHVVPGVTVLLNLLPELPDHKRSFFSITPRFAVRRVTYRLLRSLGDPSAVEAAVRAVLPQLRTLSAKDDLIGQVGYREGVGHRLVPDSVADAFERELREEIRTAPDEAFADEPMALWLLLTARRGTGPGEGQIEIPTASGATLAILRSARNEVMSQGMGSRALHRTPRLSWKALVELYGTEEALASVVRAIDPNRTADDDALVELTEKYLAGWRVRDADD